MAEETQTRAGTDAGNQLTDDELSAVQGGASNKKKKSREGHYWAENHSGGGTRGGE